MEKARNCRTTDTDVDNDAKEWKKKRKQMK